MVKGVAKGNHAEDEEKRTKYRTVGYTLGQRSEIELNT